MKTLVIAPLVIILSILFAPVAHGMTPQEQQYVNDLKKAGIQSTGTDQDLATAGEDICAALKAGYSQPDITRALLSGSQQANGRNAVTPDEALQAVSLAVQDLCSPTHAV